MVADPLDAVSVLRTGKNVEADLGPTGDSLGDLDGLVELVVGGVDAVDGFGLAVGGVVGVQLEHGVFGGYCVGAVDLDFVVPLGGEGGDAEDHGCYAEQKVKEWRAEVFECHAIRHSGRAS